MATFSAHALASWLKLKNSSPNLYNRDRALPPGKVCQPRLQPLRRYEHLCLHVISDRFACVRACMSRVYRPYSGHFASFSLIYSPPSPHHPLRYRLDWAASSLSSQIMFTLPHSKCISFVLALTWNIRTMTKKFYIINFRFPLLFRLWY